MTTTKIDWATKVWNPVTGCTPVSEGCRNCYAARMSKRLAGRCGYPADDPFQVTLHPFRLSEPLAWKKPQRIFVCSMGDLFHRNVPEDFIDKVFAVMALCPQHTFMVLTKRPEWVRLFFDDIGGITRRDRVAVCACKLKDTHKIPPFKWPLPNVCLGVSIEDQKTADERIPLLLQTPAAKRFVSIEPLLGPVSLVHSRLQAAEEYCFNNLDWVIVGGETGPKARPMHPAWVRSLRDQCQAAAVPFFFKQWGEWAEREGTGVWNGDICMSPDGLIDGPADKKYVCFANETEGILLRRVGKKLAGHLLDGHEHRQFPESTPSTGVHP